MCDASMTMRERHEREAYWRLTDAKALGMPDVTVRGSAAACDLRGAFGEALCVAGQLRSVVMLHFNDLFMVVRPDSTFEECAAEYAVADELVWG